MSIAAMLILVAVGQGVLWASDWPTFRKDNQRSAITEEKLALPLSQAWVFTARYAPKPAYGLGFPHATNWEGGVEKRRIDFDRADSVVAAGGKLFFGSVGDGKVYCLDPAAGKVVWTYPTGGPIRLAPSVYEGRVYVGSDDGWVYCLSAADGSLAWRFRGAPDDHRVIGNGSLISLWPIRTGVLVDRDVAYFGAGIFPTEGVFLHAVDAKTGRSIWRNDQGGEMRMAQISPQGYLLATSERLVVPMARQAPAIYDRKTGDYLHRFSIYFGGGTFAALSGGLLFTGWESACCFRIDRDFPPEGLGGSVGGFPGGQLVAAPGVVYSCGLPKSAGTGKNVLAIRWTDPEKLASGKDPHKTEGKPAQNQGPSWSKDFNNAESIILAGDTLFVGGIGVVAAMQAADGRTLWTGKVDGSALSLTVADGRLYVSTDKGKIHCFAPLGAPALGEIAQPVDKDVKASPRFQQAADTILKLAPVATKGFALIYGVETGELALELARRTEMKICAVSPDEKKVAEVRRRLDAAGVLGGRVVVEQWPLDKLPYTCYFADLVVSETAIVRGKLEGSADEVFRLTKPIRGAVVLGRPGPAAGPLEAEALRGWLAKSPLAAARLATGDGVWAVFTRPPLEGAKPWTDQYGGPGGTGSSEDELVRAPLRVQWFGDPGPEHFVDRHYWGAAPLAFEGRLLVCSYEDATAYDVYNGTRLWSYPLKNAVRAHLADVPSNVVVGKDGYFVAVEDVCYRLDPATGRLLDQYKVPAAKGGGRRMWGYVGCQDGVLLGTRTLGFVPPEEWRKTRQFDYIMCSDLLFAIDVRSGKALWEYPAEPFRHNCLVSGDGSVFLSHPGGSGEAAKKALAEAAPHAGKSGGKSRHGAARAQPGGETLVALDLKTGEARWQQPADWSTCGGDRGTLIYKDGRLLQLTDVGGCKAFNGFDPAGLRGPSVAVRNAKTGDLIWIKPLDYRSRAVLVGETIYAEPWAYDVKTGERKTVEHPITGKEVPWQFIRPGKHCGPFNASAHTLFFRSGGFGYCDVLRDEGVATFDSNRPNCWTSYIAAEGVALWPTSDSGCRCPLAMECSLALVHVEESRVYADCTPSGPVLPVKHLALHLGAAGDRRDDQGRLWFAYPRPRKYTPVIEFPFAAEFQPGGRFTRHDSNWNKVAGTASPWVYTSAAAGLSRLAMQLRNKDDGKATYAVELALAAPAGDLPGQRVFDIVLQGKPVKKGLDIVKEAGAADTALVLNFDGIEVTEKLVLELVAAGSNPGPQHWPVLCGVVLTAK
jgi:outer membrane protein assembly factor BamB